MGAALFSLNAFCAIFPLESRRPCCQIQSMVASTDVISFAVARDDD